jgi:hypothetical protein
MRKWNERLPFCYPVEPTNVRLVITFEQCGSASGTMMTSPNPQDGGLTMATPNAITNANAVLPLDDKSRSAKSESVAEILTRCKLTLIADWLARAKKMQELNDLHLSDEERTGRLPQLLDDLVVRLNRPKLPVKDGDAIESIAAIEHGALRRKQGYTAAMLMHESRILEVTIFGTLNENISILEVPLLLPGVVMIADEVDAQLTQTIESFMKKKRKSAA